jgi:hypothetical protein
MSSRLGRKVSPQSLNHLGDLNDPMVMLLELQPTPDGYPSRSSLIRAVQVEREALRLTRMQPEIAILKSPSRNWPGARPGGDAGSLIASDSERPGNGARPA